MNQKRFCFSLCLAFLLMIVPVPPVQAQDCRITGIVLDQTDQKPLPYAYIILINVQDTAEKHIVVTNTKGSFSMGGLKNSVYKMKVKFISYHTLEQNIVIHDKLTNLGKIFMMPEARKIDIVKIIGNVPQAVQRGDTTDFNADAFKVNKDATTEDLVKKLPGVTIDNTGTVTAKGEQVKQVLVDGKPMFGDDPTLALRNLPAEIVDKIQVFDKLSDQSELTGFDDGNTTRTMNIVTRENRRNGQFGKLTLGYGDQDKYIASGSLNLFNGNRRITLIGLSNNINQQNFSMQDILGAIGQSGQRMGGMMSRGGMGFGSGGRTGMGFTGGNVGGRNSGLNNFLVGQQNGISSTNSIGLNYSDRWGSKTTVTASYFFNKSNNMTILNTNRQYLLSKDSSQYYNEASTSHMVNFNHRFNARIEYIIDSANSLLFIPSASFQANHSNSSLFGVNSLTSDKLLSQSDNTTNSNSQGYNLLTRILYRHRFAKKGRTISIELATGLNNKDPKNILLAENKYMTGKLNSDSTNQWSATYNDGHSLASNLVYTEPVSTSGQLSFTLNNSYSSSRSDKGTFDYNYLSSEYASMDTILSNKYDFGYQTNRGGIAYRYRKGKLSLTLGMDYQNANFAGNQIFPRPFDVSKSFNNFLPNSMIRLNISQRLNLQFNYRTSTNPPSIAQLQNVIDNSNPLILSMGNPDLRPEYTHTLFTRFSFTNTEKSTNFFAFLSGSNTRNNIGTSTIIARKDTLVSNNVLLRQGSQLTKPMNFGQDWNFRSFFVYGFTINPIKCNLNLNTGFTYTQSPGYINGQMNLSNSCGLTQGLVISSNISEKVDFIISYSANYNIINNSVRPDLNENYLVQNFSMRSNIILQQGFVFQTDLTGRDYNGLSEKFNQQVLLWNMAFGKKFLKNQNAEIRISVFDLLDKNNSIIRNVTETYIEDQRANTMGRYFMLIFTYNLRNFRQQ